MTRLCLITNLRLKLSLSPSTSLHSSLVLSLNLRLNLSSSLSLSLCFLEGDLNYDSRLASFNYILETEGTMVVDPEDLEKAITRWVNMKRVEVCQQTYL